MLSSHEILKRTGIKNAKTLTRWHQRGLIPPPEVKLHPGGRGKIGYWPDWVLERCIRIKQLVKQGHSLDKLAATLSNDWAEEERKAKRGGYRFKDAAADLDHLACRRNFAMLVTDKIGPMLSKLGVPSKRIVRWLDELALREQTAEKAISLVRDGYNALLVFDGDAWDIVPDIVVGLALGHRAEQAIPLLAVPIFAEVVTAFSPIEYGLPTAPTITLVPSVMKTVADRVEEYDVLQVGVLDFELSKLETTSAGEPAKKTSSTRQGE